MTPLDHALAYAARGWRVAPIPPGHKHPAGITDWQAKATTDPDRIRRYWTAHPTHGVCIVTGPESGVWALDIDPDDGGDDSLCALEAAYGPLPDTVQSLTGGGGTHYLFAWPDEGEIRNSASGVLGVGIDVRGVGGQIVVAPTIHPNGHPYAWEVEHDPLDGIAVQPAPQWLVELLQRPLGVDEPRRPKSTRPPTGDMLPGDWWCARTTWPDELQRRGWTLHSTHHDSAGGYYELWTRPGKTIREGASASLYYGGSDTLKVFSSNAQPLQADATYQLWGFEVAYAYGGDFTAGARAVRGMMDGPRLAVAPAPSIDARPARRSIVHNGRQLHAVVTDGMEALAATNTPPTLFVRSGQMVRLREDEDRRPMIEALRAEHVRSRLSDAADWYRALKDGELTATPPPLDVATSVVTAASWPLPALAGVVELPVLRPDGSFHIAHGYDEVTRLYHWHRGAAYPAIPDSPTADQLAGAVALVDELLCDFPWDTTADRANAWALLVTPLVRAIVGQVPMALIDAPEPGTGKGLLVKACSIVTTGHAAALMSMPPHDEELEKKITAILAAGQTVVVFDNVEGTIRSAALAAALTADTWQGRILGRSEMTTVPNRATWAATGNNIDVGGDLARRCYRIRLDARQAQPWLRTGFRHPDLERWAQRSRGDLLVALCTIVRSWWVAGQPMATDLPAMGGYSSWVRTVGGILAHAGVTDFLANLADFHASADREAGAWEGFLHAWSVALGEQPVTVGELIVRMGDHYGMTLRDALPDDLSGEFDRPQFSKRLGHALRKRVGRHYGAEGLHLVEMPRDRRRVAIFGVTTRSVELFPGAGSAPTATNIPRRPDASTRDDANERGIAGSLPAPCGEKNPEGKSANSYPVAAGNDPAIPRLQYETPGHGTFDAAGSDFTSRADVDDDFELF